jgi:dienelactone hydrolase
MGWRRLVLLLAVAFAWPSPTMGVSFEQAFAPPSGRGPVVLVLSGASGPQSVEHQAAKVAHLEYYAVLLDGRDFHPQTGKPAEEELRRVIERAQRSVKALPGKAAVIGFSRGGGGALTYAAPMGDVVSAIVAYYPVTVYVSNMRDFVGQFQVPILVMAGDHDGWCPLDSLRAMEAAAQAGQKPFELVLYPRVEHAFAALGGMYSRDDDAAAWQRTTDKGGDRTRSCALGASRESQCAGRVREDGVQTRADRFWQWRAAIAQYGAHQ